MSLERIVRLTPALKDDRGFITNVLESDIKHVSVIFSMKGAVRGNHYHKQDFQHIFLVSGKYRSESKQVDIPDGRLESLIVEPGDLVITPPMVAHRMTFLEDSIQIALYTVARDRIGYSDTYPYILE